MAAGAWMDRICGLLRRLSIDCRFVEGPYVRKRSNPQDGAGGDPLEPLRLSRIRG